MKVLTDEDLVAQYRETQNPQLFEALYTRHCDKVYRKCLYYMKDEEVAADTTHDIFIKVFTKISTYNEKAKFSTWLYSIVYNHCMDQIRFKKQNVWVSLDSYPVQIEEERESDLETMAVPGLKRAMGRMSPDEQTLLLLRYQDDFSYKEIGAVVNTSEQSAKMRVLRAKGKLKKYYLETLIIVFAILSRWASKLPFRFF